MNGRAVVRAPNHLGDALMALPALRAAAGADVVVVRWLAPLLELAREGDAEEGRGASFGSVIAFDRGVPGMVRCAARLRRGRYDRGVLLTPALSAALLFTMGGVRVRRGTATDSRRLLLTDPVDPRLFHAAHRASTYAALVTGELPATPPRPTLRVPRRHLDRWHALVGPIAGDLVGIFPGSNAPSRRWDAGRFAELARALGDGGHSVAVFGSGSERGLTARVAGDHARDMGGRTDIAMLAAGLASCRLVVSNDSGPLHLAAAVGTPTVSLWGAGDPAITGVYGRENRILRRPDLPCVPCVKNECPRTGRGYYLEDAERECIRLITVEDVHAAVAEELARTLADGRKES